MKASKSQNVSVTFDGLTATEKYILQKAASIADANGMVSMTQLKMLTRRKLSCNSVHVYVHKMRKAGNFPFLTAPRTRKTHTAELTLILPAGLTVKK